MSIRHFTGFAVLFAALAGCDQRPAEPGEPARGVDVEHRADRPVEPDNTARNAQDRNEAAKTPFDQAENGSDIALTAAIRREILKTDNLSTNADNVKIITENGRVTLRGVVESPAELDTVKAIAVRLAGSPDKVDSQLEVDPDGADKVNDADKEHDADKVNDADKMDDKLDRDGDLERDARPVQDPAHR